MKTEFIAEAAKGFIAVLGAVWAFLSSSQGVATFTVAYIGLQSAYLTWKWYKEAKGLWKPWRGRR